MSERADLLALSTQVNRQFLEAAVALDKVSKTLLKMHENISGQEIHQSGVIQMDMFRDDYDKPPRL